jgi:predicted nucleic acid-binding protein
VANSFYFDASALAKRYVPEKGSAQVHAILNTAPGNRTYVLNVGAGEVVSIFVRKRNAAIISAAYFG